jgi:hypothetical protein
LTQKTSPPPAVNIVIPNLNGRRFLETCLGSVEKQTFRNYRLTIVDNGSTDGSVEYVRKNFPAAHLLIFPENRGFCTAVNAGINSAETPFVLLLNNDTELAADCLEKLVDAAGTWEEDFFAPKILNFHQRDVLDGAGDGILRGGAGYRLGGEEKDGPRFRQTGIVFGACGGAAFYRSSLFDRIGLFDEDFFAYSEDADLNLRANRYGCRCRYIPDARVFHIGSATTGSKINSLTVRLTTRNNLFLLVKNYPLPLLVKFLPAICIFQFFWFLHALRNKQLSAYLAGVKEFIRNCETMRRKKAGIAQLPGISDREFAARITRSEREVLQSIMRKREEQHKSNFLYSLYVRLLL